MDHKGQVSSRAAIKATRKIDKQVVPENREESLEMTIKAACSRNA